MLHKFYSFKHFYCPLLLPLPEELLLVEAVDEADALELPAEEETALLELVLDAEDDEEDEAATFLHSSINTKSMSSKMALFCKCLVIASANSCFELSRVTDFIL